MAGAVNPAEKLELRLRFVFCHALHICWLTHHADRQCQNDEKMPWKMYRHREYTAENAECIEINIWHCPWAFRNTSQDSAYKLFSVTYDVSRRCGERSEEKTPPWTPMHVEKERRKIAGSRCKSYVREYSKCTHTHTHTHGRVEASDENKRHIKIRASFTVLLLLFLFSYYKVSIYGPLSDKPNKRQQTNRCIKPVCGAHEWINLVPRQLNSSAQFGRMKFDYHAAFSFSRRFNCV